MRRPALRSHPVAGTTERAEAPILPVILGDPVGIVKDRLGANLALRRHSCSPKSGHPAAPAAGRMDPDPCVERPGPERLRQPPPARRAQSRIDRSRRNRCQPIQTCFWPSEEWATISSKLVHRTSEGSRANRSARNKLASGTPRTVTPRSTAARRVRTPRGIPRIGRSEPGPQQSPAAPAVEGARRGLPQLHA